MTPFPVSTLPAAAVGIGWRHPHYGELLESAGGALPWPARAPDFLEVHAENFFGVGGAALAVLTEARTHWPVSLHGVGLGLGSAIGVDAWHLERLAALVARVRPALVSDHACFSRGILAPGTSAVHAADLLPLPFSHEALDVLSANVQHVQERLKCPILVENLSAYLDWSPRCMDEPAFLAALVSRTGCKLLLDVNNLYVNELNRAIASGQLAAEPAKARTDAVEACCRWMSAVPADAVAEIHLAGHCAMDDIVIDDHGSRVCDEVWQLHRHALNRFGPVPTLIEWDTDIPPLSVLLDEAARARVQSVETAERHHDALEMVTS
jgi:uncharacterized protein (UPF0276 family)